MDSMTKVGKALRFSCSCMEGIAIGLQCVSGTRTCEDADFDYPCGSRELHQHLQQRDAGGRRAHPCPLMLHCLLHYRTSAWWQLMHVHSAIATRNILILLATICKHLLIERLESEKVCSPYTYLMQPQTILRQLQPLNASTAKKGTLCSPSKCSLGRQLWATRYSYRSVFPEISYFMPCAPCSAD